MRFYTLKDADKMIKDFVKPEALKHGVAFEYPVCREDDEKYCLLFVDSFKFMGMKWKVDYEAKFRNGGFYIEIYNPETKAGIGIGTATEYAWGVRPPQIRWTEENFIRFLVKHIKEIDQRDCTGVYRVVSVPFEERTSKMHDPNVLQKFIEFFYRK